MNEKRDSEKAVPAQAEMDLGGEAWVPEPDQRGRGGSAGHRNALRGRGVASDAISREVAAEFTPDALRRRARGGRGGYG